MSDDVGADVKQLLRERRQELLAVVADEAPLDELVADDLALVQHDNVLLGPWSPIYMLPEPDIEPLGIVDNDHIANQPNSWKPALVALCVAEALIIVVTMICLAVAL